MRAKAGMGAIGRSRVFTAEGPIAEIDLHLDDPAGTMTAVDVRHEVAVSCGIPETEQRIVQGGRLFGDAEELLQDNTSACAAGSLSLVHEPPGALYAFGGENEAG